VVGEDYLGLRELGIAAEFGMSSLSIPKKLLRGKRRVGMGAGAGNAYVYFLQPASYCVTHFFI
jgi:transcriptional activator SPT7